MCVHPGSRIASRVRDSETPIDHLRSKSKTEEKGIFVFESKQVNAPAKVILFGEHAVLGGHMCIAVTVNRSMRFSAVIVLQLDVCLSDEFRTRIEKSKFYEGSRSLHSFGSEKNIVLATLVEQLLKQIEFGELAKENDCFLHIEVPLDDDFKAAARMGLSSALCVGFNRIMSYLNNITDESRVI